IKTQSKDAEANGSIVASAHTASSRPCRRPTRNIPSDRSTATDRAAGKRSRTSREKSPVPDARSRTSAFSGSDARKTPRRFQRPSMPYEITRVMKSYLGAILLNISRIKRVSWRSAGIVMVVANLTRFTAREVGVISVHGRREIRSALELRGQICLRHGCGLRAHLAFHLAAR